MINDSVLNDPVFIPRNVKGRGEYETDMKLSLVSACDFARVVLCLVRAFVSMTGHNLSLYQISSKLGRALQRD